MWYIYILNLIILATLYVYTCICLYSNLWRYMCLYRFTQNTSSFICSWSALCACNMVPNHEFSISIGFHMTEFVSASPMLSGSFYSFSVVIKNIHICIVEIYTYIHLQLCTYVLTYDIYFLNSTRLLLC